MIITVGVMISSTIPEPADVHSSSSSLLQPGPLPEKMISSDGVWREVTWSLKTIQKLAI